MIYLEYGYYAFLDVFLTFLPLLLIGSLVDAFPDEVEYIFIKISDFINKIIDNFINK